MFPGTVRGGPRSVLGAALVVAALLPGARETRAQDADIHAMDRLIVAQQFKQAQQLAERRYGAAQQSGDAGQIAVWSLGLATADVQMDRFDRAEALYQHGIAFFRKKVGEEHKVTATALVDLGHLYSKQARLDEAERLIRQGLAILERVAGPADSDTGHACDRLAFCLCDRGRFGDAERYYRRAFAIFRAALGPGHPNTITSLLDLAQMYHAQGREAESTATYNELVAMCQRSLRPDDPILGTVWADLGNRALKQNRLDHAESYLKQALAIVEKNYGPTHSEAARLYGSLGQAAAARGRQKEAEALYARCLSILEKSYGADSPELVHWLFVAAADEGSKERYREAGAYFDRAIAILERTGADPDMRYRGYLGRAVYAFSSGRTDATVTDDLKRAMDLAEARRGLVSGGTREKAQYFASFSMAFETMVGVQLEIGEGKNNPGEAFSAMERFHARSLLDEMQMAGADADAGRPPGEREALKLRETELHRRVADLESQLANETGADRVKTLRADLVRAKEDLYRHYRAATESSPVYRALFSRQAKLPTLTEIQHRLTPGDLLLEFLVGGMSSYVIAATSEKVVIQRFWFNADESKVMGVPQKTLLNADLMRQAFLNQKGNGLLQQLANPSARPPVAKLEVMWNTVVPEPFHKSLTDGTIKRMIVIPDGPLGLFPFETLMTDGPQGRAYLLNSGPPIVYAPSAAVWQSLAGKVPAAVPAGREAVLTLGDPAYPAVRGVAAPEQSARSRFSMAGGTLPRLPYSATEAKWVARVFRDAGTSAVLLTGETATESALRGATSGRKVVHLACHGLADETLGNFFASLALTPGVGGGANQDDDGFLTLKEIYSLNLKSCELAILSACETNFGPEQTGEGTLALSRGFLIAGARRVVASNWLVDDEAAASLVSVFCSGLADAAKKSESPNYARSLQTAKRWIRSQKKWQAPYFWASLEMVGAP